MNLTLVEVAGANFRTDDSSDLLNTSFLSRLGLRARYMPARLAIARSLAVSLPPPPLEDGAEPGKAIKGDTLFGTGSELTAWLSLIVEHSGRDDLSLKDLVAITGAHWHRGIRLLDREWESVNEDLAKFIRRLVDAAELPAVRRPGVPTGGTAEDSYVDALIDVPIGEISTDTATEEKVLWSLNGPGGSPHSAIMGGVGSGKTRTAASMLKMITAIGPTPLLAFDFKGDLGTDSEGKGYHLDTAFHAQTVQPPRIPVPLRVLTIKSDDPLDIAFAAERFRESFGRLKGHKLGDKQRDAVFEAASRALRRQKVCELHHIRDELKNVYAEREMKEDGAIAALNDICRFPLFDPKYAPAEFFSQSWIVKLPSDVPETSRGIVVNLILDAMDQHLNSLSDAPSNPDGSRGLRLMCVIDEAHRILGNKLPSLASLIRMSRSKGGSIMLISQSPDDFSGEDDDFLSEMGLVVAFATNARPAAASRILGRGANLATLQTGQCFVKRRGDQMARRVLSWRPKGVDHTHGH